MLSSASRVKRSSYISAFSFVLRSVFHACRCLLVMVVRLRFTGARELVIAGWEFFLKSSTFRVTKDLSANNSSCFCYPGGEGVVPILPMEGSGLQPELLHLLLRDSQPRGIGFRVECGANA